MTIQVNWNWAERFIGLCIAIPLFSICRSVDWLSDAFFIAALIAAGIFSMALSWTITPKMERKWKKK